VKRKRNTIDDFDEAWRLLEAGKVSAARALFERASRAGESGAALMVGYCWDTGVPRSRDKALHWYRRAVADGDAAAASNIGTVFRDEGKIAIAMRWFRRALAMGHGDALIEIAKLQGGPSAEGKAAQESLRRLLAHPSVIPVSREEALALLK
jgi:TPR repeat protein